MGECALYSGSADDSRKHVNAAVLLWGKPEVLEDGLVFTNEANGAVMALSGLTQQG